MTLDPDQASVVHLLPCDWHRAGDRQEAREPEDSAFLGPPILVGNSLTFMLHTSPTPSLRETIPGFPNVAALGTTPDNSLTL